jgi:hypothetical protein
MLTEKKMNVTIFFSNLEKRGTGKPQDLPVTPKSITV